MSAKEKEEESILASLDSVFFDVALEGTDNMGQVQAHKSILASRSKYFKALFYGRFFESWNCVVVLEHPEWVLRAVVQHCYACNVELLEEARMCKPHQITEQFIERILELISAADYYAINSLTQNIADWIISRMEHDIASTWKFLVAIEDFDGQEHPTIIRKISHKAMLLIAKQFTLTDEIPFVHIPPRLLEKILANKCIMAEEVDMFRFVQKWQEYTAEDVVLIDVDNSSCIPSPPVARQWLENKRISVNRQNLARSLIYKYIRLDLIRPSDMIAIVNPSGLTGRKNAERISYEIQAPGLSRLRSSTRRGPQWKTNGSQIFKNIKSKSSAMIDMLLCHELKSGLHVWSMKAVKARYVFLGLGLMENNQHTCATSALQFGYTSRGQFLHKRDGVWIVSDLELSPRYSDGNVVTFSLDLTGKGTLGVRVDKGDEYQLCDNVWGTKEGESKEEEDDFRSDRYFVPIILLRPGNDEVRFLGFDETPDAEWTTGTS